LGTILNIMNATSSVSFFERLYLPASNPLTLEEIIILIRTRRWEHEITAYRAALAALFRGLASTLALFVSPGGQGLKVFVVVDTGREHHAAAFAAVAACYEQASGLTADRACKDICRCCYVSDDPEAWYNPDAETFSPASVVPAQVFVHDWLRAHPALEGNRNHTVYRLGCEANRRGFNAEETARFSVPLLQVPDFSEEEILQSLSSAYQGNTCEHDTRRNTGRTQKDKKDTATISGEELRERTPFLPSTITDGLPPLLADALRFYADRRERDMAFLAGTPGQFSRLVPDVENGFASRLLLYTCRSQAVWQDVSSAGEAIHFDTYLSTLSERVMEVALLLRKRRLQVLLTQEQWVELNRHFERLLHETDVFGDETFLGAVKRHGLMAYRLCMIFTALEAASLDYGVDKQYCNAVHFRVALAIVDVCLEHSRLLMTQLKASDETPELTCPDYFRQLFDRLPAEFNLSDLYALTQAVGISDRTVRRHLSRLEPQYITRLSPGLYRKTPIPAA
jgi:hypothetical protein